MLNDKSSNSHHSKTAKNNLQKSKLKIFVGLIIQLKITSL